MRAADWNRVLSVLFALLFTLTSSSYLGLRGGLLPQLDRDEIMRVDRMPAISYEIEFDSSRDPWGFRENEQLFRDAFVDARRGPADDGMHIHLGFHADERFHVLAMCLRGLWMFSLGILPSYSQTDLWLMAEVEFKGKRVREYRYDDRLTVLAHILLLPWFYTDHSASRVYRDIQANMLMHVISDLRKDLPQILPKE